MRSAFGKSAPRDSTFSARLRSAVGTIASPEQWQEQLSEIVALVESSLRSGPHPPPAPCHPPAGQPLGYTLADAAITSPDTVESYARGALAAGYAEEQLLAWALPRAKHPTEAPAAAATVAAILRERGYAPLVAWASAPDAADPVHAVTTPEGVHADLFAVPRRPYLLGQAIARKFVHDYPYTGPALEPLRPLGGDRAAFRPELVPALSQEKSFQAFMSQMSAQEYEDVILPLSRVPGVNALVLAALLLDEILDPMEILGWIGGDINQLPRPGTPNRPEDIFPLDAPGTPVGGGQVKYMLFSDIHRDAPQDVTFKISHFSHNESLYLRALEYCDTQGYTVIENGDCEELWYEPTFDPAQRQTKLDRLKAIVQLHQPVYQKLRVLDAQGRYFRAIGNHDSYLWEDPAVIPWRLDPANEFPPLHGGFMIPDCKTMEAMWPHIGLNAGDYIQFTDMLVVHGHHFDFWNCDEHNRLGKFITNLLGVPFDAFDNIVYDYRGIDMNGHPLIEFWDVLGGFSPWNNWPTRDLAREWAQSIAYRPLIDLITQDSIIFSETLAAAVAFLMNTGTIDLQNFGVLLCIGHTHNPQSRPWIPYLAGYNPWRNFELLGARPLQTFGMIKTRYLNSGTVGWWDDVIWATEITEKGQPRLVYWCDEDMTPVTMDWELSEETTPTPGNPLPALEDWYDKFVAQALAQWTSGGATGSSSSPLTIGQPGDTPNIASIAGCGPAGTPRKPDITNLERLLAGTTTGLGLPQPGFVSLTQAGLAASLVSSAREGHRAMLAALTLAARQNPSLGGADPRSWPAVAAQATATPIQQSSALGRLLWPQLLQGADARATTTTADFVSLIRALFWSYAPPGRSDRMPPTPSPSKSRAQ